MCGFVGILEFSEARPDSLPQILRKMNARLAHRGPDDEGYLVADIRPDGNLIRYKDAPAGRGTAEIARARLGFAHKRLSILDLSPAAAQPLSTEDQNLWIVYNGEIFNYVEIREELLRLGENFHTSSDTEVILKAYRQWGEECLARFNGMWAFALWDRRLGRIFCSRDRFGIKPFYYYADSGRFLCASEIKALLLYPGLAAAPDDEAVYDYLALGLQDHSERTFFENIRQLAPSHSLTIDCRTGEIQQRKWWDLTRVGEKNGRKYDDAEEQKKFYDLLKDSVRLRLRSDVPIGVSVSGGLDSTAVACLIDEIAKDDGAGDPLFQNQKRKAFSACYEDPACDDRPFIRAVTEAVSMEPYEIFPKAEELWNELEEMTWVMDEPFRSSNQFSQWSVMKLVGRHKVRVALSGQGSDEFLAGYRGYASVFIATMIRNGMFGAARREWQGALAADYAISKKTLAARILYGLSPAWIARAVAPFEKITGRAFRTKSIATIQPDFYKRHAGRYLRHLAARHADWGNLPLKLYHDLFRYSLPPLLHYEDRSGMAFSIEARQPFLDHRLVEFAFSLPSSYKIRDGQSKWIERKALEGKIPEKIQNRKDKKGFITPETSWMKAGEPVIRKLFSDGNTASASYINPHQILRDFSGILEKNNYNQHTELWRPLNLEVWMRRFF